MSAPSVSEQDRANRQGLTERREQYSPGLRLSARGMPNGWLLAGLGVAALGALALYRFYPDLARYIKMERM